MSPFIKSATPTLLGGAFASKVSFSPGLNILCGENGTGKTQLLTILKPNRYHGENWHQAFQTHKIEIEGATWNGLRVQAISPKRNTERRSYETAIRELRQNNKNIDSYLANMDQQLMADSAFTTYPSLAEHFYYEYEVLCRDGGHQIEKMTAAVERMNGIIRRVLEHLQLIAKWENGAPKLSVEKYGSEFPIEALSCGEKEILALILNLYLSREKHDVFLIDEPEIHLNWHLEERLFSYLQEFSENHKRQLIIATHSRAIFRTQLIKHAQFLYWDSGKIQTSREVSEKQARRISGEAIEIIKLGQSFSRAIFFVEDKRHELILEGLARAMGVQVSISIAGNSANVASLYRLAKTESEWGNCYFVRDGDNQGSPYPNDDAFIHLDAYCIENYLLNLDVCAAITEKSVQDVKHAILSAINKHRKAILDKNKFFEFLFDRLTVEDIVPDSLRYLDASIILEQVIENIGRKDVKQFVEDYAVYCIRNNKMNECFPRKLVAALDNIKATNASAKKDEPSK